MSNFFKHSLVIREKQSFVDITPLIRKDIHCSGILNGIVVVYCPHTTAGITINENCDPYVKHDLILGLDNAFPISNDSYMHFEGNSSAHIKSSTVGASSHLIINNGSLILGKWQNVYFAEFDGPRNRSFYIKIIEG